MSSTIVPKLHFNNLKNCSLQENFFDEYQMGGVDAQRNDIYLEIIAENFNRALKTAQNAKSLKIKLTKKQNPCLTVEVELVSCIMQPMHQPSKRSDFIYVWF